jgi:hypothetical protein
MATCVYCREFVALDLANRLPPTVLSPGVTRSEYAHPSCDEARRVGLKQQRRDEAEARRNGRCHRCGFPGPAGLCARDGEQLCYECLLLADGKAGVEQHHILGRANDDTSESVVTVPANLHRHLSACLRSWPEEIRANVTRDPLLQVAAEVRSYADFAAYTVRHFRRASDVLIAYRHWLVEQFGEEWWKKTGVGPLWAGDEGHVR